MKALRSLLVLFGVLVLGLSFAVPAEDVADTPFDESQSLAYESALPVLSNLIEAHGRTRTIIRRFTLFQPSSFIETDARSRVSAREEQIREFLSILSCPLRC